MKSITKALAAAALIASTALPAEAGTCLSSFRVDHTTVSDSRTILFHMRDGAVWKNTLRSACPALAFHGYVMQLRGTDEVCADAQSIQVLQSGEVCMLGAFTKTKSRV